MFAPDQLLTLSAAALAGLAMLAALAAWGWREWLRLKHHELELAGPRLASAPPIAARIEVADLKERVRKLEAIAAGVEL